MTIDEAIAQEREKAKEKYLEGMLCHENPDDGILDGCIESGKYHEQVAEWLEDYKHIKQWKPDVMDDFCRYDVSSFEELVANARNKAIDDFVRLANTMPTVEEEDGEIRPMWLEEIAEQLKAGDGKKYIAHRMNKC